MSDAVTEVGPRSVWWQVVVVMALLPFFLLFIVVWCAFVYAYELVTGAER